MSWSQVYSFLLIEIRFLLNKIFSTPFILKSSLASIEFVSSYVVKLNWTIAQRITISINLSAFGLGVDSVCINMHFLNYIDEFIIF